MSGKLIPIRVTTPVETWQDKQWPDCICCRPQLGDLIISQEENPADRVIAKIVRVLHTTYRNIPVLELEVHSIHRTIRESRRTVDYF